MRKHLPGFLAFYVGLVLLGVFLAVPHRLGGTREIEFDLTTSAAGPKWSIEWARDDDPALRNGAWIDLEQQALDDLTPGDTTTLTIEPSGQPTRDGRTFRLWLYEARPLQARARAPDLKAAIRDTTNAAGGWQSFQQGPGVVYVGNTPGKLTLTVPAAGVELRLAKTQDGGPVTFRLGSQAITEDLFTENEGGHSITLRPSNLYDSRTVHVRQPLPNYRFSTVTLAWHDQPPSAKGTLSNVRVIERLFGFEVDTWRLRPAADNHPQRNSNSIVVATPGQVQSLKLELPSESVVPLMRRRAGVFGLVAWAAFLLPAFALTWLVRRRLRLGPWRFLTLDAFAIFAAFVVHGWLLSWAPFMHCPDSIDYLSGVARYVEPGGTLNQFKAVRVPGYAVFVAPFWRYAGEAFNYALGATQTLLNLFASILAYLTARRLMPRPWPAITLLLVAFNPLLLLWSRFAMSESLSAFVAALVAYSLVRFFHAPGDTRSRTQTPRLATPIAGAVLLGILCGLSAYVRGNFQVFVALVPLAIAMSLWSRLGFWRSSLVAGVSFAFALGLILPRILENNRDLGVPSFMVGSGYAKNVWTQDTRTFDYNQTRVFTFERARELHELAQARRVNTWNVLPDFLRVRDWPGLDSKRDFGKADLQYNFPADESWARHPIRRWERGVSGFANILGLYPWLEVPGYQENSHWTHPLRGHAKDWPIFNHFYEPATIARFDEKQRAVFTRTARDISRLRGEVNPQLIDHLFGADRLIRPVFASLMILGACVWVARRQWAAAMVPGLVLANAGALAILALGGIDRYGVPFEPLLRIGAAYGAFQLITWLNSKKT